jgi:hypothetical protein
VKLVKSLIALVVLVVLVQTLRQVVPPLFYNYQFEDAIKQEAMAATYSSKSEEDIRESVFRKAAALKIPLNREQIQVQRDSERVSISAAYTVHIDVPFYPFDMTFTPNSGATAVAGLK